MKVILQREQLLDPLHLVIGAVDHKQSMPILSNIMLHIGDNELSLIGTDLEIELIGKSAFTPSDAANGKMLLPARKLYDICRSLPESAPIELYREKERIILKSDRSRFSLLTLPVEEFPNVTQTESHLSFTLPQQELKLLLQRTVFAMAELDVR